jgi:hypothetical protein
VTSIRKAFPQTSFGHGISITQSNYGDSIDILTVGPVPKSARGLSTLKADVRSCKVPVCPTGRARSLITKAHFITAIFLSYKLNIITASRLSIRTFSGLGSRAT